MKKIVCFIIVLIFSISILSPLSVFADVTIEDNNENILTNEQTVIGRKLALLEIFSDLITNGVNEISINATGYTVDDYLDNLWNEIENAFNNPSDRFTIENMVNVGTGASLASLHARIIENSIKNGTILNSLGIFPQSLLLTDFFLNYDFDKLYEYHPETLDAFRNLSLQNNDVVIPDDVYSWLSDINNFFVYDSNLNSTPFYTYPLYGWYSGSQNRFYSYTPIQNLQSVSYCADNTFTKFHHSDTATTYNELRCSVSSTVITIRATVNQDGTVDVEYDDVNLISSGTFWSGTPSQESSYKGFRPTYQSTGYNQVVTTPYIGINAFSSNHNNGYYGYFDTHYDSFTLFANSIYSRFCNINLYVNDVPWVLVRDINSPNLNIDGILQLLGQNMPVQYYFPDDITIDYDKLYNVIKNAIDNNNPIDMQTINNNQVYNDSHNTVYSPTIINNYSTNDGNEADFIDSVLDLATIPKFDEAYVRPINEPFTQGVGYALIGADVVPSEIKFIFGAIFVLLIFVLMINRFFE